MKDKTDSMNMDSSVEGAVNGFTDPGKPEATNAPHKRRMAQGGLLNDSALEQFENADGDEGVPNFGGFLKRNNYTDRF